MGYNSYGQRTCDKCFLPIGRMKYTHGIETWCSKCHSKTMKPKTSLPFFGPKTRKPKPSNYGLWSKAMGKGD